MNIVDQIRLLIDDRTKPPKYIDEELEQFYQMQGCVYLAASHALRSWAASEKTSVDSEKIGDYSYSRKQVDNLIKLAEHYEKLATPSSAWV